MMSRVRQSFREICAILSSSLKTCADRQSRTARWQFATMRVNLAHLHIPQPVASVAGEKPVVGQRMRVRVNSRRSRWGLLATNDSGTTSGLSSSASFSESVLSFL